MPRKLSSIAPDWWDYTTLDTDIIRDAASLTPDKMLKLSRPRLCQQCHIETSHPTKPYGRDTSSQKFVMGRSCSSCHVNIHGSNHPSGHAFTR